MTDMNYARFIQKKAIRTKYQKGKKYRIEIEGQPKDLDFYVSDISYGPVEIETKDIVVGMVRYAFPQGAAPVSITMTMRDNQDERVYNWFSEWASKLHNGDGTSNAPLDPVNGYVRNWSRIQLLSKSALPGKFPESNNRLPSVINVGGINVDLTNPEVATRKMQERLRNEVMRRLPPGLGNILLRELGGRKEINVSSESGHIEIASRNWKVIPTNLGEITEARDDGQFLTFPITLVQFRS